MTFGDFVGLPFKDHGRERDGVDCWGLVRLALRDLKGLALPDYGSGYPDTDSGDAIAIAIREGLVRDFRKVDRPQPFDLVIFALFKKPWHVGLVVDRTQFLHSPQPDEQGIGGTSRVERFTDSKWRNRIEGFYRYAR